MKKGAVNTVFVAALIVVAIITVWAVGFSGSFKGASDAVFSFLTINFGWLYLIAMLAFFIFCIVLAVSKYGSIKLGPDDSVPEFSTVSWFAMLFACGKGVGLVFWGIAEPIAHYMHPAAGIAEHSAESAKFAFEAVFTHWGVSPWANYAIIGLALAYFQFRKGKPALISSAIEPLVGEKLANGWLGKSIDVLAIFATIAGVVTSLGLGVTQINSGFEYLFGVPSSLVFQIATIAIITVIVILSAVSGLAKGIKLISDANLYIVLAALAVCFLLVPQVEVLNNLVGGLGAYIQNFFTSSLMLNTYGDNDWVLNWRIFYWAWWIAWAPFVGLFIARISKGRTVREFVLGVVLAPALGDILWFSVFGTMGITLGQHGILSFEALQTVVDSPETGLFLVLQQYPFGMILSVVFLVLLISFFIASANSGTYVLAMLSSEGDLNPPSVKKILWGVLQATLAVGLLMAGGLRPLQSLAIAAAFPFIFIMFATMISTVKAFKEDGQTPTLEDPDFEAAQKDVAVKAETA